MLLDEKNRGKKQQTDHRGEDKYEMQHNYMYGYTKCVLFKFETQTFLEWNTP